MFLRRLASRTVRPAFVGLTLLATADFLPAEETRYYQENGVTYRETRQVLQRPVYDTRLEERPYTYFRERYTNEYQEVPRSWLAPVTEYNWEQRWETGWNPFRPPVLTYRYVPRTRWEWRTESARVPVVRRELVPETLSVRVPVTVPRTATQEIITRVAVDGQQAGSSGPAVASTVGAAPATSTATLPPTAVVPPRDPFARTAAIRASGAIGGIARYDNDPPRSASGWRPAGSTIVR